MTSRRQLLTSLTALVATAVVTACTAPATAGTAATRSVTHEFGATSVPAHPQRVVALDEAAAMSALAVGVRPAAVFGTWGSAVAQSVLTDQGVAILPAAIGPPPSTETILSARPDLVVFTSVGDRTTFDRLGPAVPTIALPAATRPWQETLALLGTAFDSTAQATRIAATIDARIAEARSATGTAPGTAAVLISYAGTLAMATPDSPAGQLLAATGLHPAAPPAGATPPTGGHVTLSPELLPDIDADRILVFGGGVYDAAAVLALPTFGATRAARAGRAATVVGEPWFATDPFSTFWMAADLTAIAAGTAPAAPTDAGARFRDFAAAVTR